MTRGFCGSCGKKIGGMFQQAAWQCPSCRKVYCNSCCPKVGLIFKKPACPNCGVELRR